MYAVKYGTMHRCASAIRSARPTRFSLTLGTRKTCLLSCGSPNPFDVNGMLLYRICFAFVNVHGVHVGSKLSLFENVYMKTMNQWLYATRLKTGECVSVRVCLSTQFPCVSFA